MIGSGLFEVGGGFDKKRKDDSNWQAGKFLKNGIRLFAARIDSIETDKWYITAESQFRSMRCPPSYGLQ